MNKEAGLDASFDVDARRARSVAEDARPSFRKAPGWFAASIGRVALWTFEHRMLAAAHIGFVALILLPGGEWLSRYLGLPVLLLMAGFGLLSPGRRSLVYSNVLLACALYLVAMTMASLVEGDVSWSEVGRQFRVSVLIVAFLAITGSLVAAFPNFPRWLFLGAGTVCAAIAAANIYLFVQYLPNLPGTSVSEFRLISRIGMDEYYNSTNISATYAVMFIGVAASLSYERIRSWKSSILILDAGILGTGILLTQARSAILATFIGLIVLSFRFSRRSRWSLVAVAATAICAGFAIPAIREAILARGTSLRFEVWQQFLGLIMQKPWFGFGSFSPAGITTGDGIFLDQAHNLVLSAWFRGGVASAAAMAFILVAGILWCRRHWQASGDIVPLSVAAVILTAGMFDYQLMATYPTWPWVTFWLPFGLSIGAEMAARIDRRRLSNASSG